MALTLAEAQEVLHQLGVPRLSEEEMRAEITTHFALGQLDLMEKIGQEVDKERYLVRKEKNARIGMGQVIDDVGSLWHLVDTFMNGYYQYIEYDDDDEIIWQPIEPHRFCGYLFQAGEMEFHNDDGLMTHPFHSDGWHSDVSIYGWRSDVARDENPYRWIWNVGHTRCTDPADNSSS